MTIAEEIEGLARRAEEQASHIRSEQDTKSVLVAPFIRNVLGFNTEDARQVRSEYGADVMGKKFDKVDYALFDTNGNPVVVIEAKRLRAQLDESVANQLKAYFYATDSAPIGICTNGVQYLFYADLDNQNKMDSEPFLVLDLRQVQSGAVTDLANLIEGGFDALQLRSSAERIRNRQRIVSALENILSKVPDGLVKLVMQQVGEVRRGRRLAEFREDVQRALSDLLAGNSGAEISDEQSVNPPSRRTPVTKETESEADSPEVRGWVPLADFRVVSGKPPQSIRFSDGKEASLTSFARVYAETASWLAESGVLRREDLPLMTRRGSGILANSAPIRADGSNMIRPEQIGNTGIYIDVNFSAADLIRRTIQMIEQVGQDPRSIMLNA